MDVVQAGRVELRHLRAFEAVARLESFTLAAQELSITQPALSRTIKQLEDALEASLLDRTSRHVATTPAGRVFLGHVERILTELGRGVDAVRQQASIRLGFSWLLPDPWAQDTVARFERTTRTTVSLIRTDDALGAVQQGRVDIALVRGHVTSTAVRIVHLFDEPRVAVCSVHSPLAKRAKLDWAEVPRWPLVVNTASGTTGPWSWPAGDGPETIVETTNFDEWIESVAADRGIGVIPDVAIRRNIHPGVRFVALRDAPDIPVALAFVKRASGPVLRRFIEAAVDAAANQ
ncbi:LysR family transcriptional regulator [Mycobacterium avium subsp. hominissuis]|uniref:LysR family transcriptional regulator n=1 Tax=Mycobacterium avium TaxID=1764 RepID=UPI001CC51232|nr:LysR family transcriptional regulator [Mycobacterium avium]MBZ4558694.1 LysR family transcriptional regulator [Mycobacterium avium subsp. hominissuis]MBZ4568178.1 LysR family transcriptional regulator [Mycobacterium avium subsp. hominissuis]MBZ4586685.1 LysR family transcriptional regulator [Mycobacterium avium subsp. hominissuis]MBZ4624295.1 LysR family transcriptional regulator [Mycobacterium avium subsp. hominissuis]